MASSLQCVMIASIIWFVNKKFLDNQYSFSDDPNLLGRPENFKIHVREVYVSAGAGFVVVLTGAVMTMPGLPKKPAAYNIDVDDNGVITGLF